MRTANNKKLRQIAKTNYEEEILMKNELMIFEGKEVEILEINGKVLFNPKDVAEILDIKDVNSVTRNFNDKQIIKLTNSIMHGTHFRKLHNTGENFLTESGVYKLIMRSNKPDAEKFQDWVTDVVLPSIRQNGGYITNQENMSPDLILANAILVANNVIEQQKKALAEARPKVEFFDTVADSKDAIDMSEVAKVLNTGLGRNKIFAFLRERKVLRHDNTPYQEYVDRGWFKLIETYHKPSNGDVKINVKTVVFQKGIDGILKLLNKYS